MVLSRQIKLLESLALELSIAKTKIRELTGERDKLRTAVENVRAALEKV